MNGRKHFEEWRDFGSISDSTCSLLWVSLIGFRGKTKQKVFPPPLDTMATTAKDAFATLADNIWQLKFSIGLRSSSRLLLVLKLQTSGAGALEGIYGQVCARVY